MQPEFKAAGLFLLGLVAIVIAAEFLVRGCLRSARKHNLSPVLAGALIIGFGTSLPELGVAAVSGMTERPGLAYGAIVGSNIANLLLVLALPAVFWRVDTAAKGARRSMIALILATAAWIVITHQFGLTPAVGLGLMAGLVTYLAMVLTTKASLPSRRLPQAVGAGVASGDPIGLVQLEQAELAKAEAATPPPGGMLFILIGLALLPAAAHAVLEGGQDLARLAGLNDSLIGLTLLAVGTSLPEIAAGIAAAFHKRGDLVLGNVIGASIFNLLAAGGLLALFSPTAMPVSFHIYDHPMLLLSTLLIAVFVLFRMKISRLFGLVLLILYAAYLSGLILGASKQADWPLRGLAPAGQEVVV
jgi:cation:H+ antiporter